MKQLAAILWTVVAVLTAALPARAVQDYGAKYFEPTTEVVTPHIAWARPNSRGPLKVLFVTYRQAMREVVELGQRLDMESEVFVLHTPTALVVKKPAIAVVGENAEDETARLAAKLTGDFDLIVLGHIRWDALPLPARVTILSKVKGGTGLLARLLEGEAPYLENALQTREDIDPDAFAGFPHEALPAFRGLGDRAAFVDATLQAYRFGAGRIVLLGGFAPPGRQMLTPAPEAPFLDLHLLDYEYYLAFAIHAMLLAAERPPEVGVAAGGVDGLREEPPPVTFAVSGALTGDEFRWVLRDRDGRLWREATRGIAPGAHADTVAFAAGALPAGEYLADLWVMREGAVAGFGSCRVAVDSAARIDAIEPAARAFGGDEPVAGTVRLNDPGSGLRLRLRLRDERRGLVGEAVVPVGGDRVAFAVAGLEPLSIVQELEAALLAGEAVVDIRRRPILRHDLRPAGDAFQFYIFEPAFSKTFLQYRLGEAMAAMGFDGDTYASYYDRKDDYMASVLARANMRTVADIYNARDPHHVELAHGARVVAGEYGPVRDRCLSDPAYRADSGDLYTEEAKRLKPFSTCEFNLGDECAFLGRAHSGADACFSPFCIEDFRAFLKADYGTLAAVNEEYGADYADWAEVLPVTLEQARAEPRLVPRWVDHRRHMESVYAGAFARAREVIEEVVPDGWVGFEGSGSRNASFSAEDHWKLCRAMTLNGPYPNRWFSHAVRDFSPAGPRIGAGIVGAYPDIGRGARNAACMAYWPWFSLFQGANSVWIYEGTGGRYGGLYAVLAPDFSPYPYFRHCIREVRAIKEGIGTLLLNADRSDEGIAVLYSASSAHLATLTEGFPRYGLLLEAIPGLLEESGFHFRFLSYAQLERGELAGGGYGALILPYAQALSPGEVAQIKAFARGGGLVLADLRPGVADEHGRPYDRSPLDELFGVKQDTRRGQPVASDVAFERPLGVFEKPLAASALDASLQVAGGTVYARAGEVPAVVVHPYGTGRGVLLNLSPAHYGEEESPSARLRGLLAAVLAESGLRPAVQLEPRRPDTQAYLFSDGPARYVGLLKHLPPFVYGADLAEIDATALPAPDGESVEVVFAGASHVYDVRRGDYLGHTDRVARRVVPGQAHLLALLPYRVKAIDLRMPDRAGQGDRVPMSAAVTVPGDAAPGFHILRFTVIDPSGIEHPALAADLKAPGGRYEGTWPAALDQAPGSWTFRVRDTATGVETSVVVEIHGDRPAPPRRVRTTVAETPGVPAVAPQTSVAPTAAPARCEVFRMPEPAGPDGTIGPEWQGVPWAAGFRKLTRTDYLTAKQTRFKVAYDETALYVAVECDEQDVAAIRGSRQDRSDLWKEDSIEVFVLPPGAQVFHQFSVNPEGARWSMTKDVATGVVQPVSTESWSAVASKGEDTWIAELRIPSALLAKKPEAGETWRCNVARNIATLESGGDPHTTWAPLRERFQDPAHFGAWSFRDRSLTPGQAREIESAANAGFRQFLRQRLLEFVADFAPFRESLERLADRAEYQDAARCILLVMDEAARAAAECPSLDILADRYRRAVPAGAQARDLLARAALNDLFVENGGP